MMTLGKLCGRIRAHAKINLTLHVGATRDDGYHDLETVFQSLALHDTVTCTLRPGPFQITCDDASVPTDRRNLVWKAAEKLWRACGRRGSLGGVEIDIVKHIPAQAGLGGGSTDAAAALRVLAALWKPRVQPDLAAIAAEVGADVPYFLMGGTALGLSRGERLYPLPDVPTYHVVLGQPAFGVSTVEAYRWLDEARAASSRKRPVEPGGVLTLDASSDAGGWNLAVRNDLEAPVMRRHPEIGVIRDVLARSGAVAAAMTGSGSAVFGLFETARAAQKAAQRVAAAGFMALLTTTVGRRDLA